MTKQIKIAGYHFDAPERYQEGHVLTGNEVSTLNQTYHENLRNNFASKVKAAVEAGTFDQATMQSEFDTYAAEYQFGVRLGGAGGVTRLDPVTAEARAIARAQISAALKAKGVKVKDITKEKLDAAIEAQAAKSETIALAEKRVAEKKEAVEAGSDVLAGLDDSSAPEQAEDEAPRRSRKAA